MEITLKNVTKIFQAKETKSKFSLGDEEVENIFDILEQEHPDLWNVMTYAT